jgi:hypothetical protein
LPPPPLQPPRPFASAASNVLEINSTASVPAANASNFLVIFAAPWLRVSPA